MATSALVKRLDSMLSDTLYTHKAHEKAADRIELQNRWIFNIDVVLFSTSTANLVAFAIEAAPKKYAWTALLVNSAALAVAIIPLKSGGTASVSAHREIANQLRGERESIANLKADLEDGAITEEDARVERDAILKRLSGYYKVAIRTSKRDYIQAKREIENIPPWWKRQPPADNAS